MTVAREIEGKQAKLFAVTICVEAGARPPNATEFVAVALTLRPLCQKKSFKLPQNISHVCRKNIVKHLIVIKTTSDFFVNHN
ncbi:MAG: hypothetical protein FD152_398 [Xanthobacteraceae bacterium]|nr:MAG: hypothetical protein FD152_398 [Xanthobacteraceae bacterium]